MHNYQLNIRSCHDRDCDYGRQSLTLAMQNFSIWTSFPQISIEMGWEMGNIFGNRCILTPLHNINRQNVKANKFILGRLGENQP